MDKNNLTVFPGCRKPFEYKKTDHDGELTPRHIEHMNVEVVCNGFVLETIWDDGTVLKEIHNNLEDVYDMMKACL